MGDRNIDPADTSDLRLPDDLQFLAEQLVNDAEYLEQTFPANAPQNWKRAFAAALTQRPRAASKSASRAAAGRSSARVFGAVASAAAAVVVLAGWYSFDGASGNGLSPAAVQPGRVSAPGGPLIPAGLLPGWDALLRTEVPQRPKAAAPVVPLRADYFDTMFSGPEQEAVIDVLIENQIREPSVRY